MSWPRWMGWLLLSLPGLGLTWGWLGGGMEVEELLHVSGETSGRLLILTLAITPLIRLLPTWRLPRWLLKHRRALGVASFGYAVLHTVIYGVEEGWLHELLAPAIAAGWLALVAMAFPGLTSNDVSARWLRRWWKPVQRVSYAAAVLTAAHWLLLDGAWGPVLVHFVPLALLEANRVARR